jgi:uncharacterized membrane protein
MRVRSLIVLWIGLICASQAKADSTGVFTYQAGSFTTIPGSALDTPLGIDSAGDLLLATVGNIGGPVLLSGGTLTIISVPAATTEAYSLSQNGTVFGSFITGTRTFFTDLSGSFSDFAPPGSPRTTGNALINDKGQIILSNFSCCNLPDFIYDVHTASVTPVNYPGATVTSLIAINNNGQVLGEASGGASGLVYFIYDAGTFTTLSLPAGCTPDGINDSDAIVGNCLKDGIFKGFLDQSGVITYIVYDGNSNVNDTLISDINNSGEIVGTFSNVPEASTVSQLSIGLLFLAVLTLRTKRFA